MKKGEKKQIIVKPEDAYGKSDPNLIKNLDRDSFPKNIKKDTNIFISSQDNKKVPGIITKISKKKVVIDLNHPLAGKILKFSLKILDIS